MTNKELIKLDLEDIQQPCKQMKDSKISTGIPLEIPMAFILEYFYEK